MYDGMRIMEANRLKDEARRTIDFADSEIDSVANRPPFNKDCKECRVQRAFSMCGCTTEMPTGKHTCIMPTFGGLT